MKQATDLSGPLNCYEKIAEHDPRMRQLVRAARAIEQEYGNTRRSLAHPALRDEDRAGLEDHMQHMLWLLDGAQQEVHFYWMDLGSPF